MTDRRYHLLLEFLEEIVDNLPGDFYADGYYHSVNIKELRKKLMKLKEEENK
jgi:hypothetical protein